MSDMTKAQKRHLRELANRCYEIEMSKALQELDRNFGKWKEGQLTVWDLNNKIHQHHNGTARELYKCYELIRDPVNAVARGVAKGIIQLEDVQKNCWPLLERIIEYYDE